MGAKSIAQPWGKTDSSAWHHLAHHCADVAACFEAIAMLPVVWRRLETAAGRRLSAMDISRLAVLVFLHDCGKLHPGFQAKGWPEGIYKDALRGHLAEGAAIFLKGAANGKLAENLHVSRLLEWGVGPGLLYASLAHHGQPFALKDVCFGWQAVPQNGYDPIAGSAQLGHLLPRWFADAFQSGGEPLPDASAFAHLFCGLVSLADWLGSD